MSAMAPSTEGLDAPVLAAWDPRDRPVHCSNCLHAKVSAADGWRVACAQGHGKPRALGQLLRRKAPAGFRRAATCPDFTSMDD